MNMLEDLRKFLVLVPLQAFQACVCVIDPLWSTYMFGMFSLELQKYYHNMFQVSNLKSASTNLKPTSTNQPIFFCVSPKRKKKQW